MRHLLLLLALAPEAGLAAVQGPAERIEHSQPLANAELALQRGGFSWNGLDIQLGAEIRSYLDDELVMRTNFGWTYSGASAGTASGAPPSNSVPNLPSDLLTAGGISLNAGNEAVVIANHGKTAFIHRADGLLQNIILNTANNTNLRQEMDVQLDIGNFAPVQDTSLRENISSSLSSMINMNLSVGMGL